MFTLISRILGGIVLGIVVVAVVLYISAPDRFIILVIGSDQRGEERARSDVLFLFSLAKSPREQSALITIPRDSKVIIPERGLDKLTHAYAYGEREEGSILGNRLLTTQVIEDTLNIRIDGTVEVTFQSFQRIVDALGGVHLMSAGHVDGEEALAVVRNRYREGGDFARTADQRELFRALLTKIKHRDAFSVVYNLSQTDREIRVDIPRARFLHFAYGFVLRRFGRLSLGDVHSEALPGSGGLEYAPQFGQNLYFWNLDEEGVNEIAELYLR